jgi:hypothetical protein
MSQRLEKSQAVPRVNLQLHPGTELILRLLLCNQMTETILLRPTLDDWVIDDGEILPTDSRLDPRYVYLFRGSNASYKMTIWVPSPLQAGQRLKSWLRFPAVMEQAIPIELELVSPAQGQERPKVVEFPLSVSFPLGGEGESNLFGAPDKATEGVFGLLSGLMDLDKIPSGWLVAELLVILCQNGEDYAQTEPGRQLLDQLRRTSFFKNGAIAFASAQVPGWISKSLSAANALLKGKIGQDRLLYIWECWLWNLAQTDIETGQTSCESSVPPFLAEAFVAELGMSAERWFAGIVLGLTRISPRIAAILEAIALQPSDIPASGDGSVTRATYNLVTGLPGLDTLPARWLVLELLLILSQTGEKYTQTQPRRQLLDQLSRTRFFKNGILALASAQAPRWLAVTHEAAVAYQASVGGQIGQGGLLDAGEQWLWSLVPSHLNVAGISSPLSVTHSSTAALVSEMGMYAERWFAAIVLGLAEVSPRIATRVAAIAALAPHQPEKTPPVPIILDDVIGETGSIL